MPYIVVILVPIKGNINLDLIIKGCLNQKRGSQKRLYEHFYGYAMSIALRYSNNSEDSLEILNDGFYKVFKFLDRYDADRPFKVWLRRIIVNAAIDHQRKYKIKYDTVEIMETHADLQEDDYQAEMSQDILVSLQQLSPQYRMVFNLYIFEGYKHDEIAEKLGISAGTSRSNLLRAKSKLKVWLGEFYKKSKAK